MALGLVSPRFGDTRGAALARKLLSPLRRRDVIIPFGACSGTPFNAGGSAPSFALGTSEPHVQATLHDLLQPGHVFYDIGANVGFHTVLGSQRVGSEGRVYSFEPLPGNVEALRHNVRISSSLNVSVMPCAITDRVGTAMLAPAREPFWARLNSLPPPPGARAAIPVRCWSIDKLVRYGQIRLPHVVKIDVEGAELSVLRGMADTLAEARPAIICEVHGTGEETHDFLTSAGYTVQSLARRPHSRSRSRHDASRHVLALTATTASAR
ncbi:FkbM family methyltransferase [Streptomyces sp. bgisy159]|uniref:FkbM family methyltransferase n=1 Tax=Streptomyces sp. bgisy159 TaxID=3413795 RepID=UPI003F4A7B6B